MVGIPKSKRCDFCRWRKTKCDEAWPTCGKCKKAGKECSGPSKRVKFVNNGSHTRDSREKGTATRDASGTARSGELSGSISTVSLLNIRNRTTMSGATFSKMRIHAQKPTVPSKVPGSPADLLAGKVVMYLASSEGTGYSLSMFLCTLGFAPPLLQWNEALFDATDLLLSTWERLRRGSRPEDLFDLASYSRALRSLQKVLNDSREHKSSSTLAAAIYLQMSEYLFDRAGSINPVSHSNGIYSLIMARGPPKPGDTFGCHLILDSFTFLFRLLLLGDIDNFFIRPEWQNALTALFSQYEGKIPVIMEMSRLVLYSTMVAEATKRFSKIRNMTPELLDLQELEDIAAVIDDADLKFRNLDESTIPPLLRTIAG